MSIVNQAALADIFGVSTVTIQTWQAQGMPVVAKGKRGTANSYDSAKVIEWFAARETGKVVTETPKDRLSRVQAERIEMEMARERGELVPVAEIGPAWESMIVAARQAILALPASVAQLCAMRDAEGVRSILQDALEQALAHLADGDEQSRDADLAAEGAGEVGAPAKDHAVAMGGVEHRAAGGNGGAGPVSLRGDAVPA